MTNVRWYPEVDRAIKQGVQQAVDAIADEILKEARGQLEDGNHLDTHFLWQSGYTSKPSGISSIAPDGVYNSTKGNGAQERIAATPQLAPSKGAIIGFAASYALEVENKYNFFYGALERAKGTIASVWVRVGFK